jgi:hypothetical protein
MIGLAREGKEETRRILRHEPRVLLREIEVLAKASDGLGDVALIHWALTSHCWPEREGTLRRLVALRPVETPQPTVELSEWLGTSWHMDDRAPRRR